jgi:hypothetical protein
VPNGSMPDVLSLSTTPLPPQMVVPSSVPSLVNATVPVYATQATYPMTMNNTSFSSAGSMGLYPPTNSTLASALTFAPESSYVEETPTRELLYR